MIQFKLYSAMIETLFQKQTLRVICSCYWMRNSGILVNVVIILCSSLQM